VCHWWQGFGPVTAEVGKLLRNGSCDQTQGALVPRFSCPVEMMRTYRTLSVAVAIVFSAACGNTMRGIETDAENAAEKTAAGVETMDVKAALIADGRVDAGNINVDTIASTKTVVLKGSVPTAEQRTMAEAIARDQAKGYTITNNLTVAPR
jgi:predicted small secreted protein